MSVQTTISHQREFFGDHFVHFVLSVLEKNACASHAHDLQTRRFSRVCAFPLYSPRCSRPYLFIYERFQQLPANFLQKLNTPVACFIISASLWRRACAPGLAAAAADCVWIDACVCALTPLFLCAHSSGVFSWLLYTNSNSVHIICGLPEYNIIEYSTIGGCQQQQVHTICVSVSLASQEMKENKNMTFHRDALLLLCFLTCSFPSL